MIETFDVALANGITLACRASGAPTAPRVLLLHGFPEAAFVWDAALQALAPRARCVAVNLRGYPPSSAPAAVEAYRAAHGVADLAALIDALGAPVDLLVGHDWGGALAWSLAAQHPQRLRRLLIVNAPHPAAFLRELRGNPAQQRASAYMHALARPDAAARLAQDDYARLWTFFTSMGAADGAHPGGGWLDAALRERYRALWRQGLDGALNYYRASPLRPPLSADDPVMTLALPASTLRVRVPTVVLWGEADHALLPALLDGLDEWVDELRLLRVPGATHWIVHERPQLLVDTIAALLP